MVSREVKSQTDMQELRVYEPQETETLEQYFERYKDEELQELLSHPQLSKEFVSNLVEKWKIESTEAEDQFQILWNQIKELNNYGRLHHFVQRLKSVRQNLLTALEVSANHIEQYSKYGSISRLIFSAADIAGTAGGLWMRNSSFDYSDYAFPAATASGIFNAFSTITELYLSKSALSDILKQIKKDQTIFLPIQRWFQQTELLQQTILNIFPFDTTIVDMKNFIDSAEIDLRGLDLLVCLFKQDIRQLRNTEWVKNMLGLISRSNITDLVEWLIFQQSPIYLDVSRVLLQVQYSPLAFSLGQNLPALNPQDQNLWSIPVWGRMVLNVVTMLDSLKTLRRSEISCLASDMRRLKDELKAQLEALERIINYCESRRNTN